VVCTQRLQVHFKNSHGAALQSQLRALRIGEMPTYGWEDISMLLSLSGCLVALPKPKVAPEERTPAEDVEPLDLESVGTLTPEASSIQGTDATPFRAKTVFQESSSHSILTETPSEVAANLDHHGQDPSVEERCQFHNSTPSVPIASKPDRPASRTRSRTKARNPEKEMSATIL